MSEALEEASEGVGFDISISSAVKLRSLAKDGCDASAVNGYLYMYRTVLRLVMYDSSVDNTSLQTLLYFEFSLTVESSDSVWGVLLEKRPLSLTLLPLLSLKRAVLSRPLSLTLLPLLGLKPVKPPSLPSALAVRPPGSPPLVAAGSPVTVARPGSLPTVGAPRSNTTVARLLALQ